MNKLRKIIVLFFVLCVPIALMSCFIDNHTVHSSGNKTRIKKDFSNFSGISVGSGFELIIKFDNSESVEIETSDNLIPYIIAEQNGSSLKFRTQNNVHFDNRSDVKIYVSAKKLNAIDGSGGSIIRAENNFITDDLALELSGGSEFKSMVECDKFTTSLSGGSTAQISGKSGQIVVELSGGSKIKGKDFSSEDLVASLSGGSIISLIVNGKLTVNASGGSHVNYTGTGIVQTSDLSGGSEINNK
jgi:hypothetical protein